MCHEQCCRLNHYGMEYSPGSQIIINILCCGCRILLCSQHTRRLSVCLKPPKCLKKLQVSHTADNSSYSFSWMLKFISRFGRRSPSSHLKGWSNEKKGLKEILLFERTFEVIKIGLYSCRVFGFVWYVHHSTAYVTLDNEFLGNQEYHWGSQTKSLKTVHVCVCISTVIKAANVWAI